MNKNVQEVGMLQTVSMNYKIYIKKEVEADILARKVQARVVHPSDAEFKNMVRDKLLENCPLKIEHITNKNITFGPNVTGLRGKSVRTKTTRVEREYIPIPRYFYVLHKFVMLKADVMFVNGLPFLIPLSRKIKMFTAKYIPNRTAAQMISCLNKIVKLYARNGFVLTIVIMDMEFKRLLKILETHK